MNFKNFIASTIALFTTLTVSDGQFFGFGNLFGGGNHGGFNQGGFGGGGHHGWGNGYGYGSDLCAGARQRQGYPQQQKTHYNRQPEYEGYNSYHHNPLPVHSVTPHVVQPVQPVPSQNALDYRIYSPQVVTTCSHPNARDASIFEQKCIFPKEYTQVLCNSRGESIPTGTTAIITCKTPDYYSETGDILLEVCKDGKWHGEAKTLTCKSKPVVVPVPSYPSQQPVRNPVVEYVQTPNVVEKPVVETVKPVTENPLIYWLQAPSTPLPNDSYYVPTTRATTTTATSTTTPKPYYSPGAIDWRTFSSNDKTPSITVFPANNNYNGIVKCPPIIAKPGMTIECLSKTLRNSNRGSSGYILSVSDCQEPQVVGTEATYKCQMYYEPLNGLTTQYRKCKENGVWSGNDDGLSCSLECGQSNPVGRLPLITFGEVNVLGQWPWHVALFVRERNGWQLACGGTLISSRAILTAAHCVNLYFSSLLRELEDVRVDLGRFHRENDDPYVQKYEVENIISHPAYNPWTYESDIAIIIIKGTAQIGFHVRPICFPKAQNAAFDELQLADGTYATVVGWGIDETGESPDELRSAKLRVIGYRECLETFQDSDTGTLVVKSTTFCAGNFNGTNVCRGDSGGGAYFGIKTASGTTSWYIQGLVSVGINVSQGDKTCDPEKVAIFTKISPYSDWIVRVLSENDAI